jgi:hypothetical protein
MTMRRWSRWLILGAVAAASAIVGQGARAQDRGQVPPPPEPGAAQDQGRGAAPSTPRAPRWRVQYRPSDGDPWQDYLATRNRTKATNVAQELQESGYQAQVVDDTTPSPQPYPDAEDTAPSNYYPTSNWASDYNTYIVPGGNYGYGWYGGWFPGYRHRVYPGYWWNGGSYWHRGWWRGHGWNGAWNRGYHWNDGWNHSHRLYNRNHDDHGTHYAHHENHENHAHRLYNHHANTTGHHTAGYHAAARHAGWHNYAHRGTTHFGNGHANAGHRAFNHQAGGHAFRGGRGGGGRFNSGGRHGAGFHGRHLDP